jgi:hypothetical protein
MGDATPAPTPLGRPSWSGLVQLSLVHIPVKAYAAIRTRDSTPCHFFHADCGQRIRYAKHCPVHGAVDPATVVRGVACGPGQHVVLEAAELDALRPEPDRALRLERFLEPAQLDAYTRRRIVARCFCGWQAAGDEWGRRLRLRVEHRNWPTTFSAPRSRASRVA